MQSSVPGTKCIPIKPNVDPNSLPGHYFEKKLIQDMGVHLSLSNRSRTYGGSSSTSGPVSGKKLLWKICVVMLVDIF